MTTNMKRISMTPDDGAIWNALYRRVGTFAGVNAATMDIVDAAVMEAHTRARINLGMTPAQRQTVFLRPTTNARFLGERKVYHMGDRRPGSDCGNRSPITEEWK